MIARQINAFLTNLWVIIGICAILVGFTVRLLVLLSRANDRVKTALKGAIAQLHGSAEPEDASAFSNRYEKVRAEIGKIGLIGPVWNHFCDTLILPLDSHRPVFSSERAEDWFDLAYLFRAANCNLRFHAAVPAWLVGAGLCFTFVGISFALQDAKGITAASNIDRMSSLGSLLNAASMKFWTSLAGLVCSIAYAIMRTRILDSAEKERDAWLSCIAEKMPYASPSFLQAEANRLLEKQFTAIQSVQSDFFVNLGAVLEQKLSNGFEGQFQKFIQTLQPVAEKLSGQIDLHLKTLNEKLDALGKQQAEQNSGAIDAMLQQFLKKMEGETGSSMRQTAETLQAMQKGLLELGASLDDAASAMRRAAEDASAGMGRGLEQALREMGTQVAGLVGQMQVLSTEARQHSQAAGTALLEQMRATAEILAAAADGFRQQMESGATANIGRMTEALSAMIERLNTLSEQQREAGNQSVAGLKSTLERATAALEQTATGIANTLGAGAQTASERLVAATEAMRTDMKALTGRLGEALADAGATMGQSARAGGEAFSSAANDAGQTLLGVAAQLTQAGEDAGSALRTGGEAAGTALARSSGVLNDGASALAARALDLARVVEGVGSGAISLQQAAERAATPLTTTAQALLSAAEMTKGAAGPLEGLGSRLTGAATALTQAGTELGKTEQRTAELAKSIEQTTRQFDGVDRAIAGAVGSLQTALGDFKAAMESFTGSLDKNLKQSIQGLSAITQQLTDSIEDFEPGSAERNPPQANRRR